MTHAQRLAIDFKQLTGFTRDQRLLVASAICHREITTFKQVTALEAVALTDFAEAWCLTMQEEPTAEDLRLARLEGLQT